MTDYGELAGYVGLKADYDNNVRDLGVSTTPGWPSGRSWLVISGRPSITVGTSPARSIARTSAVDQIRLSWAMGGFGIMLGIEDPRDRWGTSALGHLQHARPGRGGYGFAGQVEWQVGGWLRCGSTVGGGSAWGILGGIDIKLNSIAAGDVLRIQGAYGNGSYTLQDRHQRRTTLGASRRDQPLLDSHAVVRPRRELRVDTRRSPSGWKLRPEPRLGSGRASAPSCRPTTCRRPVRPACGLARSRSSAPGKFYPTIAELAQRRNQPGLNRYRRAG